jgi:hypothetical protein
MSDADPPSVASSTQVDYLALAPGRRVGRYEILGTLGQGGFGVTYRARDTQLDRDVALKEYPPVALAVRQDDATKRASCIATSSPPTCCWVRAIGRH